MDFKDLNIVVLAGRLAAPPELRIHESGSHLLRVLVTTRRQKPRPRIDVIPIMMWDPDPALLDPPPVPGCQVWSAGWVQRRFWSASEGRRSRLEIVAHSIDFRDVDDDEEEDEPETAAGEWAGAEAAVATVATQ